MKKIKTIILICGLGATKLHAQSNTVASGGEAIGNGGIVSYSLGQVIYTTQTGTNGSIAEGIQQSYEISVVTGLKETTNKINIIYYPNPATDFVKLKAANNTTGNLTYQLYDINGKILENKKIGANETFISMKSFVSATYFLKVMENNKEVKTFKILKN